MAIARSQRIGIWIITITMLVGTVGGFIAMIVAPGNEAKDQAELQRAQESYKAANTERQKKVDAQTAELNNKYYAKFAEFGSRVGAFEAGDVKELGKEDAKGEVFDQSIADGKLKAPFAINGPANTAVIQGWKEGLVGMKIGGVRELTIPADKAYGSQGQGDKIPANAPLKFVIMAIEKPANIPQPEMPEIIKRYYKSRGLNV